MLVILERKVKLKVVKTIDFKSKIRGIYLKKNIIKAKEKRIKIRLKQGTTKHNRKQ